MHMTINHTNDLELTLKYSLYNKNTGSINMAKTNIDFFLCMVHSEK